MPHKEGHIEEAQTVDPGATDPVVNPNPKILFKDKYERRYFKRGQKENTWPNEKTTFTDTHISASINQSEYMNLLPEQRAKTTGSGSTRTSVNWYSPKNVYTLYQMDADEVYRPTSNKTINSNYSPNFANMGAAPQGAFHYDESGAFDPTSEEFKQSLIKTGSFSDLAKGYGFEAGDFEDFDIDPLKKAKEGYGFGKETLALQTGQNLFELKRQSDEAMAQTGLEGSGSVDFRKKFGVKGAFQEYLLQQKQLASDLKTDIAEFWKGTEDMFYTELDENEENT
jgi:hypothetical protein